MEVQQVIPHHNPTMLTADITAIGVAGASVAGWFPTHISIIAATLSAVYLCIQILIAVDHWWHKLKLRKHFEKYKLDNKD